MKLPPLAQQVTALERARNEVYFAYFMDQGTGKAYVGLAEAEALFLAKKIDCLIIVAPNGVQRNWISREAPKLLSIPFETLLWQPNATQRWQRAATAFVKGPQQGLKIFAVNVEAFSYKRSRAEIFTLNLLKRLRCLVGVDESSVIKNLDAARTKNVIHLRDTAHYRRIFTGTPVTQSPMNFFSQFKFLREGLLGFNLYTPFKAFYAVWRDRVVPSNKKGAAPGTKAKFKELVRYRNLHILKAKVDAHSFTIRKEDCLDLPPKVYLERRVDMSPQQAKLYKEAKDQFIVELREMGGRMTIAHAFTRAMRLSQITGGFIKSDDEDTAEQIPGPNPKLESVLQYIEEVPSDQKIIIWARFVPELKLIERELGKGNCAMLYGEIKPGERHENVDAFMDPKGPRFFIANQQCGKFGYTLTICNHVLYYSNSYSADARWQSEDRTHRIGSTGAAITYSDIMCAHSCDPRILKILMERKEMADKFKGGGAEFASYILEDEDIIDEIDEIPPQFDQHRAEEEYFHG